MKSGSGFLLVFVGLLMLWLAITGRLNCLSAFASCVAGNTTGTSGAASPASGIAGVTLPTLPNIGGIMNAGRGR